ncbi:MAG: hypothetical protein ACP5QK_04505 [Myxococcota bacterium]
MRRILIFVFFIFASGNLSSQAQVITTITENFSGKLYVYDDKDEAERGLRANLIEKMEKRLKKMGFSDDNILTLLKKAKYSNINIVEKRVEILKDNKKIKTTAFDIAGEISISIDEQDIRELLHSLKIFSPITDEEKALYKEALRDFIHLSSNIKGLDISIIKFKLAEIYKADITKQIQTVFGSDNTSFSTLKDRVIDVLNTIEINRNYLGDEENVLEIARNLTSNIENYYKRSIIDVSNYESAISSAEAISKMMPLKKDETLKSLMFIVEFKWAENIQNIAQNSNVEARRIFSELDKFLTHFGKSRFIKNIQNRITARLKEDVKNEEMEYETLKNILLIYERLKLSDKEISSDMVLRCESVLSTIESPSDDLSKEIDKSFAICIRLAEPAKKKSLQLLRERFTKTDRNRIYRGLLGNLAFLMRFVKYSEYIPFGQSPEKINSGKFADFLSEGNITSGCSCSYDSGDECRIFVYAGDQFEVVNRYNSGRLYEVGICNVNMKGKSSVVFSYLKENFKPLFKGDLSQVEDKEGIFEFEIKKDIKFIVEKTVGSVANISVVDQKLRPKVVNNISSSSNKLTEAIKRGDCVEWDCEFECRYKGKVEKIIGNDVYIIIISAPKAAELNMRKHLGRSEIQKCQSH